MNINWKLRLQNKTTLITLATAIIASLYTILAALGVTPSVTQDQVMNLALSAITIATALGIVVDPTTPGISDSERAMSYDNFKDK